MWETAVLDRIEDNRLAVLLVGEEEVERIVPVERLPQGSRAGVWLRVRFDGDTLVEAMINEEATQRAKARIQDKLQALRRRGLKGM